MGQFNSSTGDTVPRSGRFTTETAAEAGSRGGKASGEARRARPQTKLRKALQVFEDNAEKLAQQLVDAATGVGPYDGLDPKERAQFAVKALEYAIPRQGSVKAKAAEEPAPGPAREADGISFEQGDSDGIADVSDGVSDTEVVEEEQTA